MRIFLLSLTILVSFAVQAQAQVTAAAPAAKNKKSGKVTEVNFEDLLVQGKYHFSDEAVVTVEQDKVLDALLGVRTDFKDRIEQSATRFNLKDRTTNVEYGAAKQNIDSRRQPRTGA